MMQKLVFLITLLLFSFHPSPKVSGEEVAPSVSPERAAYLSMELDGLVSFEAFSQAWAGWQKIEGGKRHILTLIDFSKPSTEERLYVFDMDAGKMLFRSHVAHGQGSGGNYATSFSNVSGSHKSSLGFYLTGGTYMGGNGYSLRLDGLEKGINDKARERAIVIHGAAYANPSTIKSAGRLGRSFGCPALPQALNKAIIDTIKDGSLLFIYAGDNSYLAQSEILSRPVAML
jgi:hypothetical protein